MKSVAKRKRRDRWIAFGVLGSFFGAIAIIITVGIVQANVEASRQEQASRARQAELQADPLTIAGLYNALNKERSETGSPALSTVANLSVAAQQICDDMATSKYFDYTNPTSGKKSNDFISDNIGDLYYKTYVASISTAIQANTTATESVKSTITSQAENLNNPSFNSVGWGICQSPNNPDEKYIVAALADVQDKPQAPQTVYVPTYTAPTYTPAYRSPTTCNTTYHDYTYLNDTATTTCY